MLSFLAINEDGGNSAQRAQYQSGPSQSPGASQPAQQGQQQGQQGQQQGGRPAFNLREYLNRVLAELRLQRLRFLAFRRGPAFGGQARRGSRVRFRLRAPARIRFTVEKRARCPRRKRGSRRCKRYRRVRGSFTITGKSGNNFFFFRGRMGGKTLRPGRYRLVATPVSGRTRGRARRIPFRIVR